MERGGENGAWGNSLPACPDCGVPGKEITTIRNLIAVKCVGCLSRGGRGVYWVEWANPAELLPSRPVPGKSKTSKRGSYKTRIKSVDKS